MKRSVTWGLLALLAFLLIGLIGAGAAYAYEGLCPGGCGDWIVTDADGNIISVNGDTNIETISDELCEGIVYPIVTPPPLPPPPPVPVTYTEVCADCGDLETYDAAGNLIAVNGDSSPEAVAEELLETITPDPIVTPPPPPPPPPPAPVTYDRYCWICGDTLTYDAAGNLIAVNGDTNIETICDELCESF